MEETYGSVPVTPAAEVKRKHSSFGIASCIIAVIQLVLMLMLMMVLTSAISSNPFINSSDITKSLLPAIGVFGFSINIVGLGLGITGLFQSGQNKLFAAIGTAVHAIIVILVYGWMMAAIARLSEGMGPGF